MPPWAQPQPQGPAVDQWGQAQPGGGAVGPFGPTGGMPGGQPNLGALGGAIGGTGGISASDWNGYGSAPHQGYHGSFRGSAQEGYRERGNDLNDLAAQLRGGAPSVVDMQYQQALSRGLAGQQALAASARPGNEAMGARMAMQNSAGYAGQLGGAAMMARVQEEQMRKNMLMQLLLGQRGQDASTGVAAKKDPNMLDYAAQIGSTLGSFGASMGGFGGGGGGGGGADYSKAGGDGLIGWSP